MSRSTVLKAALAIAGAFVFGLGVRLDDGRVRWAGIALIALAFAARWAGRRGGVDEAPPSDSV